MMDNQIIQNRIENSMTAMFPNGAGRATDSAVRHHLETVATVAYQEGRNQALLGLMTAEDVAEHFDISPRRARALIQNRHERFGVGMRFGNSWLVSRDELQSLEPDEKYRPTQYQFWDHTGSGETYAVRLVSGQITGIVGPLAYDQLDPDNISDYEYDDNPEDSEWAQTQEWRLHETQD